MKPQLKNRVDEISYSLQDLIKEAFNKVAPFWPLKNLIAVNPLQGFEDLPFEKALLEAESYFQGQELPEEMQAINRETIKWCQAFFDQGQATIPMPQRDKGLYESWRSLALWDDCLHQQISSNKQWLEALPESPEEAIILCLEKLNIPNVLQPLFLNLLVTTLPGWAAHIRYLSQWQSADDSNPKLETEYLAMRLIITSVLWPKAFDLISWHEDLKRQPSDTVNVVNKIREKENIYRSALLNKLSHQLSPEQPSDLLAQIIFCIDVRSEPFRRALESQGNYETFGFAGFFGLPIEVKHEVRREAYSSCPVLLQPKHSVNIEPSSPSISKRYKTIEKVRRLYQSLKYTSTTPFTLVEFLGPFAGIWMGLRSLFPKAAHDIKEIFYQRDSFCPHSFSVNINIPFEEQCAYAEGMLKLIGLTKNFAPLVILCGHGSSSINNAYATALDCGACGGRHGDVNALALASILNCPEVRERLHKNNIFIPETTHFIAAKHNTTTDEVTFLYSNKKPQSVLDNLKVLQEDLEKARQLNTERRLSMMGGIKEKQSSKHLTKKRSLDWAETRPEWGLARNAAFVIGPRNMTKNLDLEGRVFLHSYDWRQDFDGSLLTTILTAPMVVAQWISSQYLFSTINNVAYGAGSKITHNISGKIGVMQGNASDLMHGLPLQSVYKTDNEAFHDPLRLLTVVYARKHLVQRIASNSDILKKLFSNGWVHLVCLDPDDNNTYMLMRDLTWNKIYMWGKGAE